MEGNDKPDAKVNGYVDVRHKNGERKRIELEIEYFVDDWYTMGFEFVVDDGTATLHKIVSGGRSYNVQEAEDARLEAIRQVADLPGIEHVDMGH